jgi:hypothetical protein
MVAAAGVSAREVSLTSWMGIVQVQQIQSMATKVNSRRSVYIRHGFGRNTLAVLLRRISAC